MAGRVPVPAVLALLTTVSAARISLLKPPLLPCAARSRPAFCVAANDANEALSRQELRGAILAREREIKREARDAMTGQLTTIELEVLDADVAQVATLRLQPMTYLMVAMLTCPVFEPSRGTQILEASDLNGDGKIQDSELQLALASWDKLATIKLRELESNPPPFSAWKILGDLVGGDAAKTTRRALDEELQLEKAARLVELPVMFSGEDDGSFDFERWGVHRSAGRYGRLLIGILFGVTTRRIGTTVSLLVIFSGLVDTYTTMARASSTLPEVELPLTPFELTAPVLGLLLVFRTNTAYDRFNAGSDASWDVTCRFRSAIRQVCDLSMSPPARSSSDECRFRSCHPTDDWLPLKPKRAASRERGRARAHRRVLPPPRLVDDSVSAGRAWSG